MSKLLTILCVATDEQQSIHKHMPEMVARVSGNCADFMFVQPPHVGAGPLMYGISAHRVPSDVHAVPCEVVAKAIAQLQGEKVLLLDGSVHVDESMVSSLICELEAILPGGGLALPVRYNYCQEGPLVTYSSDNTLRFEYGVLPKEVLSSVLCLGGHVFTGDVLLSELSARRGVNFHMTDMHVDRFPERILLYRGRALRKLDGLPCPDGICPEDDYHRRFAGQAHDCTQVAEFRRCMREGEIALMTGPLDPLLAGRIEKALGNLKPKLLAELMTENIRDSLPRLMASVEPHMDIFESRLDMLNAIILLKSEELGKTVRLGDREFWSAFGRYTMNDTVIMSKLLYLKV